MKATSVTPSPLVAFLQRALEGHMDGAAVIYRDLANALRRAIAEGVIGHGDLLPSERDLGELVGISRTSVRKAMDSLVDDGVLIRRQGARTAVAERVE